MRIYRLTVLAFAILATMTFSSCSTDADLSKMETNPAVNTENAVGKAAPIVFNFSVPGGARLSYTRAVGDPIDDIDEEATIHDLWMYEFDAATGELISKEDITTTATANPSTATGGITAATAALSAKDFVYEYKPAGNLTNNDARQFLFVANYPSLATAVTTKAAAEAAVPAGTASTLTDVRNMITTALTGTLNQKSVWDQTNNVIPMTAFAMLNKSDVIPMSEDTTTPIATTVDLTRIVARIDIVNNTPYLVINELILVKANNESYVLHKSDPTDATVFSIPSSDANYSKVSITWNSANVVTGTSAAPYRDGYEATPGTPNYLTTFEIPIDADHVDMTKIADINETGVVVSNPVKLEQAFYIYEDIARDNEAGEAPADALHLQVRGTLNGIAVSYNIPFTNDLVEGAAASTPKDGFAIKRNYLYTVELGDGKKSPVHTEVRAKIRVLDWDQQVVTDYFDASVFKIYDETTTNALTTSTATGDDEAEMVISTKVINVDQDNATTPGSDIEFVIASPYGEVSNVIATVQSLDGSALTHTWVTITALDGSAANKGYKVTVTPNTAAGAAVRSAAIKISYSVTPSGGSLTSQTPITYTIVQAAS